MVYWILADDSDTRFDDKDEILEFLSEDISNEADDRFEGWLEDNYTAYDVWEKCRDSRDGAYDLYYECEDETRNDVWDEISETVDECFEILGTEFICMEDDDDDELMPPEEEEEEKE